MVDQWVDVEGRLRGAYETILACTLGHKGERGTQNTPQRAARAWLELTSGYSVDVDSLVTTFDAEGYDEMIACTGIRFHSLCEHHLLGFSGEASIVYIPSDKIIGLSKMPRLVDAFARRLQNQERLTANIADALETALDPQGVMVAVNAIHSCMVCRGAKATGRMGTSVTRGLMRDDPKARNEARWLIDRRAL